MERGKKKRFFTIHLLYKSIIRNFDLLVEAEEIKAFFSNDKMH